jgi:tetratricopeptide (TPR) repeat protein
MANKPSSWQAVWKGAVVALFFFLSSVHSHGAQEIVIHPDTQFQFAEQYFERGEYYRAIGEYERLIHFFPRSPRVEEARYKIGLSYLKGERYKQAIEAFEALTADYQTTEYTYKSYLGISKAYVLVKSYDMALATLTNLITIAPDREILDEAYYQKGWVYLEMGLWESAKESFEKVSPESRKKYNIKNLLNELDNRTPLKRKDPATAGILAIVPGAGHLYCGRKKDAFISFLLNSAMIYAAYEAFDRDLDALGGVIVLFELGFYSGNIYSAISSAHKYNRLEEKRFLNDLRQDEMTDISLNGSGKSTPLVLSCRFHF